MDITFIANKLNTAGGGSNQDILLLGSLFQDSGHDVTVLTLKSEKNKIPDDPGFRVLEADPPSIPTRVGNTVSVSHVLNQYEDSTDIYQLFHPMFSAGGGLYRQLGGEVPVIGYLNRYSFCTNNMRMDGQCHQKCSATAKFKHSDFPFSKRALKYPLYLYTTYFGPKLMNKLDQFVSIGPRSKEIYQEIGIDAHRMTVIPLCSNMDFTGKKTRSPSDGTVRLLHVSRLVELKGVDVLIEAISQIESDVAVDIIGDGPVKSALKRQTKRLNLTDQITFHGYVEHDKLPTYYDAADLFIHPSRFPDPTPRTIIEAIQAGTPVIVSDLGDNAWAVGDAGCSFESGNPEALASEITALIEDENKVAEMIRACEDRREDFRPESLQIQLEDLYRDMITR